VNIQGGFGESLGSSGLPGVPCMWAPPDCLEGYVCRVIKEESWDVFGILWIAGRVVSVEAPREDPGLSLGSFGQHGGLCAWEV